MRLPSLDPRLTMLYEMVPPCRVFADVGADHAYLAIHLLASGKTERAVISDISRHALERAMSNIAKFSLSNRAEYIRADGLSGLSKADVVNISGLSAETISDILIRWRNTFRPTLILAPNRDMHIIREMLWQISYIIVKERVALSRGRYYVAVRAEYSNERDGADTSDILFGEAANQEKLDPWNQYFIWQKRVHLATSPGLPRMSEADRAAWYTKLAILDERVASCNQSV